MVMFPLRARAAAGRMEVGWVVDGRCGCVWQAALVGGGRYGGVPDEEVKRGMSSAKAELRGNGPGMGYSRTRLSIKKEIY